MPKPKKSFVLRVNAQVWSALEKWADDEFRSVNGQLEYVIAEALKRAHRYPKASAEEPEEAAASAAEPESGTSAHPEPENRA